MRVFGIVTVYSLQLLTFYLSLSPFFSFLHIVRVLSCHHIPTLLRNQPLQYHALDDWVLELSSPLSLFTGVFYFVYIKLSRYCSCKRRDVLSALFVRACEEVLQGLSTLPSAVQH